MEGFLFGEFLFHFGDVFNNLMIVFRKLYHFSGLSAENVIFVLLHLDLSKIILYGLELLCFLRKQLFFLSIFMGGILSLIEI